MLRSSYLFAAPPQPTLSVLPSPHLVRPPLAATGRCTRGAECEGSEGRKRVATAVRSPLCTRTGQGRLERHLHRKGRACNPELEASRLVSCFAVNRGLHVVACAHVLSRLLILHIIQRNTGYQP